MGTVLAGLTLVVAAGAWTFSTAKRIDRELNAAIQLVGPLKQDIAADELDSAANKIGEISEYTRAAKDAANDPVWTLASTLPGVGANFSAIAEVTRSADDVATLGLKPLLKVYSSLDWNSAVPRASGTDLAPIKSAAPSITSAAHAVRVSADRLNQIDASTLLPEVSEPLTRAQTQLEDVTGTLSAAADAAHLLPKLLGDETPRTYLLMIQNNAEVRASGGIPGALAVLEIDSGKLSLGRQSSAVEVGVMSPPLQIDAAQQQIFSGRLGKFMQDVNLTPDFPTAASTARAMWDKKFDEQVDGVISIDPVVLSYILDALGPVRVADADLIGLAGSGLPLELSGNNVVATLLSDVYQRIEQPALQDAYFAGVAQEIFSALASGNADEKGLVEGLTRGAEEGRVLLWSGYKDEQAVIAKYGVSGSVSGPSVSPAQFGVYFNDGTGAKMDYYTKRTVQLIKECPRDGYEETTVRITSTNTAPGDAATSLPPYVTGNGVFGVPPGSVQTNIAAYGPAQAHVETAKLDGQKTEFAPYFHGNRPVGVLAIRLAPGESKTVDFTFGKIVQHTEPNVVVTPTVQDVKDVTLPTETAACR
ncbi:DUF4012 domain-containing protein [Pseudarthrobacter oxydans]|uniref:DUF4012 domain-containing protein n=1 Tax=Pseudarthrobacter oxydans TaxID=1671 RepID=UPI00381A920F